MAKAYVLMNCDLGSEKKVISSLKETSEIKEAHGTLGLYDIIAKIESDSEEKIKEIVTSNCTGSQSQSDLLWVAPLSQITMTNQNGD